MAKIDLKILSGIIIAILIISGVTVTWQISKDKTVLKRNNVTIGEYSWAVGSIAKNRLLTRSLTNTVLSIAADTATRKTPFKYSTHSGELQEFWVFAETESIEAFPQYYEVSWVPKNMTSDYQLIWKISKLKSQPKPNGNYTDCDYYARNVEIRLLDACSQLERAEIIKDKITFYFKPAQGTQILRPSMQDPAAACTVYIEKEDDAATIAVEMFNYTDGVNFTVVCTGGTSNACIQAFHPDFRARTCDASGRKYFNWTNVRPGETRFNGSGYNTTLNWSYGSSGKITGYLWPAHFTTRYTESSVLLRGDSTALGNSILNVLMDWNADGTWDEFYNGNLLGTTWTEKEFYDSSDSAFFDEVSYLLEFDDTSSHTVKLKTTVSRNTDFVNFTVVATPLDNPIEEYDDLTGEPWVIDECMAYVKSNNSMYWFGGVDIDTGLNDSYHQVPGEYAFYNLSHPLSSIGGGCSAYYHESTNQILIFGGYDGVSTTFSTVHIYNVTNESWANNKSMGYNLAYQACDLRPGTNLVYCFGGHDGSSAQVTAGYWNISNRTWTSVTSLSSARYGSQIEWYNTTHAIIWSGGFNELGNTTIYDAQANSYSFPVTAKIARKNILGAKVGSSIYAYAGQDNTSSGTTRRDIFKWDPVNLQWDDTGFDTDDDIVRGHCDEYRDSTNTAVSVYCIGSPTGGYGYDWHLFYHYPEDLTVYIYGSSTATISVPGPVSGSYSTGNISRKINTAVANCPEYSDGFIYEENMMCFIPVYISAKGGQITVQNLSSLISHEDKYDLHAPNASCGSGFCAPQNFSIYSDNFGYLYFQNLTLYWQGYQQLNINGSSDGDGGATTAGYDMSNFTIYESRITRSYPYTWTNTIIFLPKSTYEKNLTPYKQTTNYGLINNTGNALQPVYIAYKLSQPLSFCGELRAEQFNSNGTGDVLNTSWVQAVTLNSPTTTKYTYFYLDLNYEGGYIDKKDLYSYYMMDWNTKDQQKRFNGTLSNTSGTWQEDTDITRGLIDVGSGSVPDIFDIGSTKYMIVGEASGLWFGYNLTSTGWQSYPNLTGGLLDIDNRQGGTTFYKNGLRYMLVGTNTGTIHGYNWSSTLGVWQADTNISGGLWDLGVAVLPYVFNYSNTLYLMVGNGTGTFYMFNWSGNDWRVYPGFTNGLGDIGTYASPSVFYKAPNLYMMTGNESGIFLLYKWNGSIWSEHNNLKYKLTSISGTNSNPRVFYINQTWYMISGEVLGKLFGFNLNGSNVDGNIDQGIYFQGVSDSYLKIGNGTDFNNVCDNGCTMTSWFNHTALSATTAPIVGKYNNSADNKKDFILYLYNLDPTVSIGNGSTTCTIQISAVEQRYDLNEWNFVAMRFNSGTGNLSVYMWNTSAILTNNWTTCTFTNISGNNWGAVDTFVATTEYVAATRVLNGTIDDLRIYNRTLSFTEIENLWKNGKNGCRDPADDTKIYRPTISQAQCCSLCKDCFP